MSMEPPSGSEAPLTGWNVAWIKPWELPAEARQDLMMALRADGLSEDQAEALASDAERFAATQRQFFSVGAPGLHGVREQLEAVCAGNPVGDAAAPHVLAALFEMRCDPVNSGPEMRVIAARKAVDELPTPKRGRPPGPAGHGVAALEDSLLRCYARQTGKGADSLAAATYATIVLKALGLLGDVNPESRQRARSRRA